MKRIYTLLLGMSLVFSVFTVCALASSNTSLNKQRTVRNGAEITDVYLKIVPRDEVETGDSIYLTYKNAEILDKIPQFGELQGAGNTWNSLENSLYKDGSKATLDALWSHTNDNYIPWNIMKRSKTMVEVQLFPLPRIYANNNVGVNGSVPYYYIPLHVTVDAKDGNMTSVYIDGNGTSISSMKAEFAYMPLEGSGETVTEKTSETETETADGGSEETTKAPTTSYVKEPVKVSIGSNTVMIGYDVYTMDAAPYIQKESSSTLVPLRFVSVAISGGNLENVDGNKMVAWDAETKTAKITTPDGKEVSFTAGSSLMNIGGESKVLDNGVKAEITNGRMFIPFRALGEALGIKVDWDAETKTAIYLAK